MTTTSKVITTGIVLVIAGGAVWLAAPLFFDTTAAPEEAAPPAGDLQTLRAGTFTGVDDFHRGSGTAKVIEADNGTYVRFEPDFSVTNGPDLFVGFGNDGKYEASTRLGKLKGSKGAQNYRVPDDIDPSQYSEVWVWCRAFSAPFAFAELN